jgi:DNA helicase-2/ATP-dependent DNA helicase PcrA
MDFLTGLNPEQRRAAAHTEGPLLILAGAGSGKTRVITHRIAHLISTHVAAPREILAVTFTNKAAGEMKARVEQLLADAYPGGLRGLTVSTFHSYCARMLRIEGARLADVREGFTTSFSIYDEDNQVALLRSVIRNLGLDDKAVQPRAVLSGISAAKNKGQTPEDWLRSARDANGERLAKIFAEYVERLRQANALDFDDLLLESVRLLRHDTELRNKLSDRFRFLMIDEYQDTNRVQYDLMRLLASNHDNVAVVGDEDQSIYSWRGADIRNILDFEQDYPNAEVIRLEQNYRSTKTILEAASQVVANNLQRKGKWLWTEAEDGPKIGLFEAQDGEKEAQFIADQIERELIKNPKTRVAVLYRTNSQSRPIEEALRRRGRRYVVIGGLSFYQRAEIRDILAFLRLIRSPEDSMSLMRILNVPARGIGKGTGEQIEQLSIREGISYWAAIEKLLQGRLLPVRAHSALDGFYRMMQEFREHAGDPMHELLDRIVQDTGYLRMLEEDGSLEAEGRIENLRELRSAALDAAARGEDLGSFLDNAALVAASDGLKDDVQVSLLTIHNAKGLEFPVVFLAGMEEGLFPHSRSLG